MSDYFDLDLDDTPKQKKQKKKDKERKQKEKELDYRDNSTNSKKIDFKLSKLQIAMLIVCCLMVIAYFIPDGEQSSDEPGEYNLTDIVDTTDHLDIELSRCKFRIDSEDFVITDELLVGRHSRSNEVAQGYYGEIPVEGGLSNIMEYLSAENDRVSETNGIEVTNFEQTEIPEKKLGIVEIEYKGDNSVTRRIYWWNNSENVDRLNFFGLDIVSSGDVSDSLEKYDEVMNKIIDSIEMQV